MMFIQLTINKATSRCKSKLSKLIKLSRAIFYPLLLTCLLTACQTTSPTTLPKIQADNIASYSHYYLWLKTLNKKEVLAEEKKQSELMRVMASNQQKDTARNLSKLILIYSLPNTSIHQPYKAKRLLNEHLLTSNKSNKENVAFTMLLRDQLNTQLKLLAKQEEFDKAYSKKTIEDDILIKQLHQQIKQVNQQLILLKKIDKNINERG